MKINITNEGQKTLVALSGSLDIFTSQDLRSELESNVVQDRPEVEIDMSNLIYVDSAGIGMLIKVLHYVQGQGGVLRLTRLSPLLERTFADRGIAPFFFGEKVLQQV